MPSRPPKVRLTPQARLRGRRRQTVEEFYECDGRPILAGKISAALIELNKREPERRGEWIQSGIDNEKVRRVRFHPDGTLLRVDKLPGWNAYEETKQSVRGKCKGFFGKSRHRFQTLLASLDRTELPLFVTLTYPDWWPGEWDSWKSHLDTWGKRLRRKWPKASAVWKLEFQERGAPHFHLIVWGVSFMPHQWLAQAWFEICGTGDEKHLRSGTSVERAHSVNGVMAYAGKKYMGKVAMAPSGVDVGRMWGVIGRADLPRSRVVECMISKRTHLRLHRLLRRYMKARGLRWKGGGITLFTNHHLQWLRAVEWAETGESGCPFNHGVPLDRQPF